jgi:Ribonuclease G/E
MIERQESRLVRNVYKGKVESIVPGKQAALSHWHRNERLPLVHESLPPPLGDMGFEDAYDRPKRRGSKKHANMKRSLKKASNMVQVVKDTLGTKGVRLTTTSPSLADPVLMHSEQLRTHANRI